MGVIFDEVIGSVDDESPEPAAEAPSSIDEATPSPSAQHEMPVLKARLREISERAARLRAD